MKTRQEARHRRHFRVRRRVHGTKERPRMAVFRSNRYIYVQVIDDVSGHTLVAASSQEKSLRDRTLTVTTAAEVGRLIAGRSKAAGITSVVFDRGGFAYHGRLKALADAAREEGLEF
ncbi:MAG TPA: 50S ribosomal protein L18 [Acidimicrobiia bacterium]|uniref:Large ribosomal subunit protein uL18 n=1 Tax=uncultured actinobacterium Rifle_16ft_4_minimus_2010 TaxID=1665146 RepID=A0A0H4T4F4_9ACTN|nr:50S ribosomal protein L18, large subunit ribosomal protein L18 [uncultured actinobacterium Rifle_16ft_4_minimus_2010]HLE38509.1 50S ribosomal protein L18 [Acidimicrobiia bacterium]